MIPTDKILHAIAGFAITFGLWVIFKGDPWVYFGIGMTAGLLKEGVWDRYRNGVVEWLDWLATIFGSLLATLLILLF